MAMASNISHDTFPSSPLTGSAGKRTKSVRTDRELTVHPEKAIKTARTDREHSTVRIDREHTVFPDHPSPCQRIGLTALNLESLTYHYDQKGLLYETPAGSLSSAVHRLEKSLTQVLTNFYPLAGRLATSPSDGAIYIDCNDVGAAFIEASAENVDVSDLTAAGVTAAGLDQLFALNGAVNIEGHRLPLLAVQVTKLRDGIFVACSINHVVVDGVSLWHFFNSWAEVCRGAEHLSLDPILDRCAFTLPRSTVRLGLDPDADYRISCSSPPLRLKLFHFSKDTVKALKDRANRDSLVPISSLQALCGHVWQAVTRARRLDPQVATSFQLSVDCRSRLVPPLPSSYFGDCVQVVRVNSTARKVVRNDVSFPAQLLHSVINGHEDMAIKKRIDEWEKNPKLTVLGNLVKNFKNCVMVGSSPRFKMYETDFGWGRPLEARSGPSNRRDGKIQANPGKEGEGSVDLEICLAPTAMDALEIDQHFLNPLLV